MKFFYDFEPQVLALFSRRDGHQAYAVYEKDDNRLPVVEGLFVFEPLHRSPQANNIKLWPGYQSDLSIADNLLLAYNFGAINYSEDAGRVVW